MATESAADRMAAEPGACPVHGLKHPPVAHWNCTPDEPEPDPSLPTRTYADVDTVIERNPGALFVVEVNDWLGWAGWTWPPSAHPTFVAAFAATIQGTQGQVCATCGLGQMGHAAESRWLGHAEHGWTPIAATASDLERANRLTSEAYRRNARRRWA